MMRCGLLLRQRANCRCLRSFPAQHLPSSRKKKLIGLVVVPGTKTMPKPPLIVISDDEDDDDQHVEEEEPPPPKRFRRPTQVPQNFRCCESRPFPRSTISPLRTHDVGPARESLKKTAQVACTRTSVLYLTQQTKHSPPRPFVAASQNKVMLLPSPAPSSGTKEKSCR